MFTLLQATGEEGARGSLEAPGTSLLTSASVFWAEAASL